jgi:hypothetical protein
MNARSRGMLTAVAAVTIALGLATRRFPGAFPPVVAKYGGDALWAMLVYWLLAILRPRASAVRLALLALAISIADELSQLIDWHWLQVIRGTRLGALVLGQGFLWSDLVCYAVGVAAACAIDVGMHRRRLAVP